MNWIRRKRLERENNKIANKMRKDVLNFISREYIQKDMENLIRKIDCSLDISDIEIIGDENLKERFLGKTFEFAKISFKLECIKYCLACSKLAENKKEIKQLGEYLKETAEKIISIGSEK